MTAAILDAAHALGPELIALRRRLHRDPEVGLSLPRTQRAVIDALGDGPFEIRTGTSLSSVTAVLRGGNPGGVVLLRADMDALPVREEAAVEYAATGEAMHACGHDLHTAALVGAARLLAAERAQLNGTVVFMFQPGEEGFDGAAAMIEEGVLDAAGSPPLAAYGAHVVPGPPGQVRTRAGAAMAGVADVHVTVHGRGGHGSSPHLAADPVPPLAELVGAIQTMITRRFPASEPLVMTVAHLRAGEAVNVIPDSATLGGTVRFLSVAAGVRFREELVRLADGVAAAHGCRAEVRWEAEYPPVVNDPAEAAWTCDVLADLLGAENSIGQDEPLMASEDFSRILLRVPGAFVLMGATPAGIDPAMAEWNHSPRVVFDDAVVPTLAAALATLAVERLRRG